MSSSFQWVKILFLAFYFMGCVNKKCPEPNQDKVLVENLSVVQSEKTNRTIFTIQSGSGSLVEDAFLATFFPNINYGNDFKNYCTQWTYTGIPGTGFFVIKFDYSKLDKHKKLISAKLTLYADTSNIFTGSPLPNKAHYGTNLDWSIKRITTNWDESLVAYATKPLTTNVRSVIVGNPASLTSSYFNIDITDLVKDQIITNNYGFEIKLVSEVPYKRLAFYSSNSPNIEFRPKLEIEME